MGQQIPVVALLLLLLAHVTHGRRLSGRESLFLTDAANNQVLARPDYV